ncbi:L,D-transpeptidase family protein [Harenicola maris]|uniref:L,D-transpeptidase family protein n=1 Tax=Harenicola maris TaxID=2841044 RepID=UPI0038995E2C
MHDLIATRWGLRFHGRRFPAAIGKGGITDDKREGDGASPKGTHRITGMLYRADRIAAPAPWAEAIGPRDLWSDDVKDAQYNHAVRAPHGYSHERLSRADPLYDLVLLTDWNWPQATPGKGSAIFIHRWRKPRHPTEGCLALRPDHLLWVAQRVQPGTRVIFR